MSDNSIHETQPQKEQLHHHAEHYVDEQLNPLQNVEGGGPVKKVDLSTMPRPIKFFGYFIIAVSVIIAASVILIDFFR